MRKTAWLIFGLTFVGALSKGYCDDRTGVLGLNYTVGPSFIAGGEHASDAGSVEPGVGAALQFGITRNAAFQFAYDYIDADLRTQAITFNGLWYFIPERTWSPFAGAGMGFGKPFSGEGWGHFALKLSGGVEKALTSDVSLAGVFSYHYVDGTDPFGSVHAIEPGIRLIYYFGNVLKTR